MTETIVTKTTVAENYSVLLEAVNVFLKAMKTAGFKEDDLPPEYENLVESFASVSGKK